MTKNRPAPDSDATLESRVFGDADQGQEAPQPVATDDAPARDSWWDRFNRWRRTRPFWGCLALALGGWFVVRPVISSMQAVVQLGGGGVIAWVLGGGMILAAGVAMIKPEQRHFPALMGIMLAVASLPLANLGGWVIGMVLGIVGGAMTFAWTPYTDEQLTKLHDRRHDRREAKKDGRSSKKGGRRGTAQSADEDAPDAATTTAQSPTRAASWDPGLREDS